MFTSEKIKHFVQSVKFGGDAENPSLQVAFYITPLTYDLCYEVDDRVAKQLFRKEGGQYSPVAELDDVTLKIGDLGAHNIEWFPHDSEGADDAGQMTAACAIGKVEASKLFTDKPDWSLIWHATIPLDSHSLELVRKYYKNSTFLTLVKTEDKLFETDDKKPIILSDADVESGVVIHCSVCTDGVASYLAADNAGYCDKHVATAVGVQVRKIAYVGEAAVSA